MTHTEIIQKCRKAGMKIDLFPVGKAGVEAKAFVDDDGLFVFVYGTDHRFDWILHFLPGWGVFAEILYGNALAEKLLEYIHSNNLKVVYLYGHSWGGAILPVVQETIQQANRDIWVYTYGLGPKKPAFGRINVSFVHSGEIVPFLTPWRKGSIGIRFEIGGWKPFWIAHKLETYLHALEAESEF